MTPKEILNDIQDQDIPALLMALAARLMERPAVNLIPANPADKLLTISEASRKLGMSQDYLYRKATNLPFTVRVGRRSLRFSEQGMDRWIRNRSSK
jgi:predicted DNA-binding transcriptional regulator AlpA